MDPQASQANLGVYRRAEVVQYYDRLSALQGCEEYVFGRYIGEGQEILDIGVGGGRTTPYLSSRAKSYTGIDYSEEMVQLCARKFPGLAFQTVDATNMSMFPDASFDLVVFSFNGLGCLGSDEARLQCLSEVHRVLRGGGMFIFSLHNACSLLVRPVLKGAAPLKYGWRILRSLCKSAQLACRMLSTEIPRKGSGYLSDPVHGGSVHYLTTPDKVVQELRQVGLQVEEIVGGNHPVDTSRYATPWYYYVASKSPLHGGPN